MNALNLSLSFLLLVGTALLAGPTAPPAPRTPDLLAEALPILQANYPDFKNLPVKEGDHLSDLIARSDGKISLAAPGTNSAPSPILTASLPDNILYWRLATFTPEKSWTDLAGQLQQASPSAQGVILDLRSNLAPDDYRGASQVLGFFAPGDATLSKYGDNASIVASANHPFRLPLVVLTNRETSGAAEVLAACLKADGALVVGSATAGKMAVFEEQKLSSGQILRYVVSPVVPPDSLTASRQRLTAPAWGQPVIPDIAVTVNDDAEKDALVLIKENHISDVIQEDAERHRMSEAALVQGQDPEWDDYLASLAKNASGHLLLSLPPIHDVALIDALDSLKAIRLAQRPTPLPAPADASAQASLSNE